MGSVGREGGGGRCPPPLVIIPPPPDSPRLPGPPRPDRLLGDMIMIQETGPSPPGSSDNSPRSLRRPQPIPDEAMRRIQLLTAENPSLWNTSKLSPLSPNYPTSDLGYSPRSSISVANGSSPSWSAFRDYKVSSSDADSDIAKDLLSPGMMLSPAPFSPFSDYESTQGPETPASAFSDSARLGIPSPLSGFHRPLHFSFDSFHAPPLPPSLSSQHFLLPPSAQSALAIPGSLRGRSHSDSDALHTHGAPESLHFPSPVPLRATRLPPDPSDSASRGRCAHRNIGSRGPKKPKTALIEKYQEDQKKLECEAQELRKLAISERISEEEAMAESPCKDNEPPKPAIGVPGPSSPPRGRFFGDGLAPSRANFEAWVQRQLVALESAGIAWGTKAPLAPPPPPQASTTAMQSLYTGGAKLPVSVHARPPPGPLKTALPWRRSRSESDVTVGSFVCAECGQAFALHDRLAKHVASRHRDRSASVLDAAGKGQSHKCTLCHKSFGRSDMLTRHMRLHTGLKPYACNVCGQVFSRSDHLSTHQRTHSGEKPYQCPQCSYAASRRDMITRHMRTHSRGGCDDGGSMELLVPPSLSAHPSPSLPRPSLHSRPGSSHR